MLHKTHLGPGEEIYVIPGEKYVITDVGQSQWPRGAIMCFYTRGGGYVSYPSGEHYDFYGKPLEKESLCFTIESLKIVSEEEMYKDVML